jgi:hypothetical protein
MSRPKESQVLLLLPDGAARDTLRVGLMALRCVPTNLPTDATQRYAFLSRLAADERVFLFVDITNSASSSKDGFGEMIDHFPRWLRSRTLLTRLANGHVSEADRAWVKTIGFCDLITEFDTQDVEGGLRAVLDLVAETLHLPLLPASDLARYVRAVATSAQDTPRALIRFHTGLSSEKLASLLSDKLDIRDRSYHLKKYPACFVGSDAVVWMVKNLKLTAGAAVAVGQALGTSGLLHHVEHKHGFSDEPLFFRLALSPQADAIDLGDAMKALQETLVIADRTYLGTVYDNCWVGSAAVDVICQRYETTRHAGHLVLHRLMQFGLLAHVVNEQPFIDGNYFYRFTTPVAWKADRSDAGMAA